MGFQEEKGRGEKVNKLTGRERGKAKVLPFADMSCQQQGSLEAWRV